MDMKSRSEWEEIEASSLRGCASVWPKIVQLRAELRTYENVHGHFEATKIEAQRHLIEIPLKETEQQIDTKIDKMHKAVAKMTDEQREKLMNLLSIEQLDVDIKRMADAEEIPLGKGGDGE